MSERIDVFAGRERVAALAGSAASEAPVSRRLWLVLLAGAALSACGRKGDLYLPDGETAPTDPESDELPPQSPDGAEDLELP